MIEATELGLLDLNSIEHQNAENRTASNRSESSHELIFNGKEDPRLIAVRTTLANGLLTIQPGRLAQLRGLFEQEPQKGENETSTTPALLNLPDTSFFSLNNGGEIFNINSSRTQDLRIEFDPKYKTKKTKFTWVDGQGKATEVEVSEFASKKHPNMVFKNITFTPHFSGNMTVATGINDGTALGDREYYQNVSTEGIEDKGIFYEFDTKYKKEKVSIGQYSEITKGDEVISEKPAIEKDDGGIYQKFDIQVAEGERYSLTSVSSYHSTADKEIIEGATYPLRDAVLEDLGKRGTFAGSSREHKDAWDKLHNEIQISIDGDDEIQQALTFNHSTILASIYEGYPYAGIGAKEGLDPEFKPYGNRHFWDGDIYCMGNLTPAHLKTMLLYRYNQLSDAREKAKKYTKDKGGKQGAFFPWQASRPGYGEGCPAQVQGSDGKLIPIEELYQEIHISADVAYFVMQNYRITGNEELLKNQGAEIIIEAARFYRNRADYSQEKDRYELREVTGPSEYHHSVNNNAFTNGMAKWTTMQALELFETPGMVTDEIKNRLGVSDEEIEKLKDFADKIYIPFDPENFTFTQFDGWDSLRKIDLTKYPGARYMDVELKKEVEQNGENPVQKSNVVKQPDAALLPNLLGADILKILPAKVLDDLRAKNLSDEDILRKIYQANHDKYGPQTCDGSSLSPNKSVEIALDAGVDPDEVYDKYREAVLIDLEGNTHGTENGLHTGALGGSMQATIRGFAGIKPEGDVLSVNPRLPTKWKELKYRSYYKGVHYQADIDNSNKQITFTLLEPSTGASIPLSVQGNRVDLDGEKGTITLPYNEFQTKTSESK